MKCDFSEWEQQDTAKSERTIFEFVKSNWKEYDISMNTKFFNSIGGGPLGRLVKREGNNDFGLYTHYSSGLWRKLMASGAVARTRARLVSFCSFPTEAVVEASTCDARVVVPTTNPFLLPFAFVALRMFHGRIVVPLIYDLYPDAVEATGSTHPNSIVSKTASWMNRYVFKKADAVVFIGKRMAAHAIRRYGEPKIYEIIETGADFDEHNKDKIEFYDEMSELASWCGNDVLLTYTGNLGLMHDWETLAEGLIRYLDNSKTMPALKIVIAASGPGREMLQKRIGERFKEHIQFLSPLENSKWRALLSRSDISVITLSDSARNTSVPSKTYSAMAAGNVIVAVAPVDSDLSDIVKATKCGFVICPGNIEGFSDLVESLVVDKEKRAQLSNNAMAAIRDEYDVRILADDWKKLISRIEREYAPSYRLVRRAIDVGGALSILAATLPISIVTSLAVRAALGSPVFFRQKRPGLNGQPFELIKFRTMKVPRKGEENISNDSNRLTRLGKLLRSFSIDELPTFWNVLCGSMSLVGPRPLLMQYLSRYSPEQARRHEVMPGITGWAQVNGRNAISWEEKLKLDVWYVDHQSLLLDLKILSMTIVKVLKRDSISAQGEATMPEFMGQVDDA